jgi:hypothetical protein
MLPVVIPYPSARYTGMFTGSRAISESSPRRYMLDITRIRHSLRSLFFGGSLTATATHCFDPISRGLNISTRSYFSVSETHYYYNNSVIQQYKVRHADSTFLNTTSPFIPSLWTISLLPMTRPRSFNLPQHVQMYRHLCSP